MRAREIKDLSIALEALSRVNGYKFEQSSYRVHDLLEGILTEEETKPPVQEPPKPSPDDEIPF